MKVLRAIIFNLFMGLWTLAVGGIGMLTFLTFNERVIAKVGTLWSAGIIWGLRVICGIKVEVQGQENLKKSPFIIASKHQSAFETVFFLRYFDRPVYTLKKQLQKIPIYGWYLKRMGMACIDRSSGMSAMKEVIKHTRRALQSGRSAVIFPEGTRIKPNGDGRYLSGIAAIHKNNPEYDVIPVALNSGKFWFYNPWVKNPGTIIIKFLPAMPKGLNKDSFMKQLKHTIDTESNKL